MIKLFSINSMFAFLRVQLGKLYELVKLTISSLGVVIKWRAPKKVAFITAKTQDHISNILFELGRLTQPHLDDASLSVGTKNALTRDNWIQTVLTSLPSGLTLLDAGAGEMQYRKHCAHLKYISQDLSQYDGSGNEAGLQTGRWDTTGIDIVSDICSIPIEDASVDAVLCTEVLEHLTDPLKALQELTRVLRPGGRLILTAPFCSLTHFAPYHYATGFNKYFYYHHLNQMGYESIQVKENGNFFEFVAQELRRVVPMAEKYSSINLSPQHISAISCLLNLLQELSSRDQGSHEMLHFDCQVLAIKK